ncbi:unnamed protein product [Orchesella dallaii]|uniref:Uncharacterized protein n=1 Tax=Orchesella dallaii TaxID=48710 RepID=A0ABP1S7R2_9HEXA
MNSRNLFMFVFITISLYVSKNESISPSECILLAIKRLINTSTPNIALSACTKVVVTQKLLSHTEQTNLHENPSTYLILSNTFNSSKEFPDQFYPKYAFACSISLYDENVSLKPLDKSWTEFVPGRDEYNVHIFIREDEIPIFELTSAVRALPYIVFVSYFKEEESSRLMHFSTLDATSENLVQVGSFDTKSDKNKCLKLDMNNFLLYKRWNFKGFPFRIALSKAFPGPRQPDFDSKRINEYPRTFNYSLLFKSLVMMMAHYVEDGINGTTTEALFDTPFFGKIDSISGEWVGLIREVMDENAHACIGLAATEEGAKVITQADAFIFDSVTFLAALPRQLSGSSVFFLFESFELVIWLILILFAGALIILLSFVNNKDIRINLQIVFQPVIDQPVGELQQKHFSGSNAPCLLISGWFIAIIVVGNLFKSRLTSVLVEPVVDNPPRTLWQLANSDYQIGTMYYKETEIETVIMHMENLTLVQKLKKKFIHYSFTEKDECLKSILYDGRRKVCMGLQTLMGTFARGLLRNKYGLNLYTFSKDILAARFVVPVISHFVSHIQGRFNFMTATMVENGLIMHWNTVVFHERAQRLRFIEKSGSETYAEAVYPLY